MANSQIANLTAGTIGFTDVLAYQDATATADAKKSTVQSVSDLIKPYKSWVGIISQTSTSAPTATVLQNDLSGTIVLTRSSVGVYVLTLASAFVVNKTIIMNKIALLNAFNSPLKTALINRTDANTITITSFSDSVETDSLLSSMPIEIRVYN